MNDKVRPLVKLGAALKARDGGTGLHEAVAGSIGWNHLATQLRCQHFLTAGQGEAVGAHDARHGREPPALFRTHLSSRFAPFHVKAIPPAGEAAHGVDGLLYHEADLDIAVHHTDGGGVSDHVFASAHLLGSRFAPRIPNLAERRLYAFGPANTWPALAPFIPGRPNDELIEAHGNDVLRLAASVRTGVVSASLMLKRLERTLHTLDWLDQPPLRRQATAELNKGETRHALCRAVCFHRLRRLRDRTVELQRHRASGLALVTAAIALWDTVHLGRAVDTLRRHGERVPSALLAHVAPLGWQHINLTGDYLWGTTGSLGPDGFRPLRSVATTVAEAASCSWFGQLSVNPGPFYGGSPIHGWVMRLVSAKLSRLRRRDRRPRPPGAGGRDAPRVHAAAADVLALSAGQLVNLSQFGGRLGIGHETVDRYLDLLERRFLVRRLQPWSRNELKRLVRTPKLHSIGTGLLAAVRGLSLNRLANDRALLESFAYAELIEQAARPETRPRFYHYRDKEGVEVDLVIEDEAGGAVGVEVKVAATVRPADLLGIGRSAAGAGPSFRLGVILYDGDQTLPFGGRLFAAPLSILWAPADVRT